MAIRRASDIKRPKKAIGSKDVIPSSVSISFSRRFAQHPIKKNDLVLKVARHAAKACPALECSISSASMPCSLSRPDAADAVAYLLKPAHDTFWDG